MIIVQYCPPPEGDAAQTGIYELATRLQCMGHSVSFLTNFSKLSFGHCSQRMARQFLSRSRPRCFSRAKMIDYFISFWQEMAQNLIF